MFRIHSFQKSLQFVFYRPLPPEVQEKFISLNSLLTANLSKKGAPGSQVTSGSAKPSKAASTPASASSATSSLPSVNPEELEKVLGFPLEYTDVGGLNRSRRQNLLSKAFSVALTSHLLRPLLDYFSSNQS